MDKDHDQFSEDTPRSGMHPAEPDSSPDATKPFSVPEADTDSYQPSGAYAPPRRGKARERMEKRKHVTKSGGVNAPPPGVYAPTPRSTRRVPRQISVPSNLPRINLAIGRGTLYVIGSILLVVVVIAVLGRLRNQPPEVLPNAIWLGTEWTYDEYTDEQLAALVNRLRENKIGTIYAWVSYLQDDDTWRQATTGAWDRVKVFRQRLKAQLPEVEIFGWLSLPVDVGDGYRLDEVAVLDLIAALSGQLITEFGFDGVFLNVEPVWNDDQNFLELLRKVRAAVGTDVPVAAAIPPDWHPLNATIPVPPLIVPGTEWATEYKQSVALLVDQLAIMSYNSGLTSPADYSRWMAYQVETYARAVAALDINTEILIGVPTHDAELPAHNPTVETVPAAIDGLKLGIEQAGDAARYVRGAVIWAGWTTDETEWLQFKRDWVE